MSGVFTFAGSAPPFAKTGDGTTNALGDLAVDATNVYFVDVTTQGIYAAPKAGSSPPTTATQLSTGVTPTRIAVGNDSSPYVYWTNQGSSSLARVSTIATANTPATVVATLSASGYTPTPYGIAVDPAPLTDANGHAHSVIYFTDSAGGAVYRVVMSQ